MNLSTREITGVIIWWAEGTKSRRDKRWRAARTYPVEVTNTNPAIIKVFIDFLRHDLRVKEDRIHLQLQIHRGDDQEELEQYWAEITGIPRKRFNKTIIRPIGNKIGKSRGTCKIRFADKEVYCALESLLKEVLIGNYKNSTNNLKVLPLYDFSI